MRIAASVSRYWIAKRRKRVAAVQNLLDAEYLVGTLPTTVGSPRFVSGDFRLRLGR